MIDLSLSDIIGGEPVPDPTPVYHVHTETERQKIFERVAAPDADAALKEAKKLLGDVDGLFVSGPHEHVMLEEPSSESDLAKQVKAQSKSDAASKE